MTPIDTQTRQVLGFEPIVIGVLCLACLIFIVGIIQAGHASLMCDPLPTPPPVDPTNGGLCDAQGRPLANAYLSSTVVPLSATLATFFGAALGIANRETPTLAARARDRLPSFLSWAGLLRRDSKTYTLIQTLAAYTYLAGLLAAGIYLFRDLQPPTTETLDSPYTHMIIKACGTSLAGVVVGVVALALGVKPQSGNP
ncbi:hypothetical protein [Mesorhizobium sp. M6A.T.Cr.TU.016.01.1.1]|uniref:hypothetical protein n=1 Tax=Mesorhizobium sp. M6A.T.Cr.TU.016.01.1.1 TaxID=2493677 RepID=UPI000F76168C|nr:hypothetical protein [Mesorhizobium sp. M6A.T.Cr.TU.016.01.1.1]AZO67998.1 hypothetical protein EJ075_25825 [Mesorhizobium sp. M6A.T.Cr.TU.016.01.1.1]